MAVPCEDKIKQVLARFLEPNCEIKSDLYFNRFLTHISTYNTEEPNFEFFTVWLLEAVMTWEKGVVKPSLNIASFTLNLVALISQNETHFIALNHNNVYDRLFKLLKAVESPSIKLGLIKVLMAMLAHKSGVSWLTVTHYWEEPIKLGLTNQTLYVTRECYKFVWSLLINIVDNEDFCTGVIKKLCLPLNENAFEAVTSVEVCDQAIYKTLSPTLQLLGDLLEKALVSPDFVSLNYKVVIMILDSNLETRIDGYLGIAQGSDLLMELGKVLILVQHLKIYLSCVPNVDLAYRDCEIKVAMNKILTFLHTNVKRSNLGNIMAVCHYCQYYWHVIGPSIAVVGDNCKSLLSPQVVVLNILPVLLACSSLKLCKKSMLEQDQFRDIFMSRIFKVMSENTTRIAYAWRNKLEENQQNSFDSGNKALLAILKCRQYFPRDRASLVFQSLVYSFKDMVVIFKPNPDKIELLGTEPTFLLQLMDTIRVFIDEFRFTWRDSVEAICILAVSTEFLSIPHQHSKAVVKALTLVKIAIEKYLSPNLALLVDRTNDSSMGEVGPLLYAKLHDGSWEVRDTALECVHSLAVMCHTKFNSMKKLLLESDLPALISKMATDDAEGFVRATAIRCLQELVKVEEIYETLLKSEELLTETMVKVLLNETEGIVRVEAATLMHVAYENQQFPQDSLDKIYETMIHSSTTDLHWEVKVRALKFWEQVIKNNLHNEGMIDGKFPTVTFSKENRKIVTLTELEIRKRLRKILKHLSIIGCLGVLVSAISDDCDVEVCKTAIKITDQLVGLFKTYKMYEDDFGSEVFSPRSTAETMSVSSGFSAGSSVGSPPPPPNGLHSCYEEVVDQIVASNDVSLLNGVYSPSDYGSVSDYDLRVTKIVSPEHFIRFTQQDFNRLIGEREKWLEGIEDLESLLDDMLRTYDDDVNKMDCY